MICRKTARVWFKDGTYMDVYEHEAKVYESQPDWHHTESGMDSIGDDDVDDADIE